jgi:hypothetical protein
MATLKEDFLSEGYIIGHRFFSNSSMFLFITLRARHIVFDVSRSFRQFAHFSHNDFGSFCFAYNTRLAFFHLGHLMFQPFLETVLQLLVYISSFAPSCFAFVSSLSWW